jgi:hypothetical protein
MHTKFNHCFVWQGEIVGTPYSNAGIDFMDSAESVCGCDDTRKLERTARILSELCLYWGILQDSYNAPRFYVYCLRRFYTLANRIESLWGEYAARSIFNTCGFQF